MITDKENYKKLFDNVIELIHQSQLHSLFSYEAFTSFPNNLGDKIKNDFNNEIRYSVDERQLYADGKSFDEKNAILGIRGHSVLNGKHFSYPFYQVQAIAKRNEARQRLIAELGGQRFIIYDIDFNSIISEQNLVYLVGLIEGFILDTVRIMYYSDDKYIESHIVDPPLGVLKDEPNYSELRIERIIKVTERKWGGGSFSTRFAKLYNKFFINLNFDARLVAIFDKANLLRNCILHNGATVSVDYYEAYKDKENIHLGEKISISRYFNEALYYLSIDLVKRLFSVVEPIAYYDNPESSPMPLYFDHSYFKDVMLDEDNWIFKRLTKKNIY